MADNLIQKKGESTWYVRLAVPADVQEKLGLKVFIQSLKTGLRKEALDRRLPILAAWKDRIRAAREGIALQTGWQDSFVTTLTTIDQNTSKVKWETMEGLVDDSEEVSDEELEAFKRLDPNFLAGLIELYRMHLQQPMGQFRFLEDMGESEKLHAKAVLTSKHSVTPEIESEIDSLIANPKGHKTRPFFPPARLKAYREFRESRGGAQKHMDQQIGKMERHGEFLTKQGLKLDFDAVDAWLKSLDRAPRTFGQYLMAGTAFWKWAMKYDARWREDFKGQANPFENHDLPQSGGRPAQQTNREAYTAAELAKLHEGAIHIQNNPLADLILLGSYTGARIEELCQLKREHVIDQDGVQSFNIVASKTKAGIRIVPVHPALKPVVARLMQDSTDDYLIPVSTQNQYDKRSHAISKAFGRLRTSLGFGPQYVFHSIRNTVVTYLARADISGPLIAELVGHETGTVTFDVYARGASAAQKLDAISKLPRLL